MIREKIFAKIDEERDSQDRKWGPQRHPDFHPDYPLELDRETAIKLTNYAFQNDCGSWSHIFVEEVSEAIEEARKNDVSKLKEELVQVAAVAIAWLEDLETREQPISEEVPF
jgi:hypothetical protein